MLSRSFRSPRLAAAAIIAALALLGGAPSPSLAQEPNGQDLPAGMYVVALRDLPLAAHPGTKGGAGESVDLTSDAAVERVKALRASQDRVLRDVDASPLQRYDTVLNGFAADLTAEQASELSQRSDVVSLTPDEPRELQRRVGAGPGVRQTDVSPDLLGLTGATGAWSQVGGAAMAGTGRVVGVVDSGIDWANPSFSADGMPQPPTDFAGTCDVASFAMEWPEQACNDKIIAADFFAQGPLAAGETIDDDESMSPQDSEGHGSHVAAIAAGRSYVDVDPGVSVVGMAPMAHLAAYKACWRIPRYGQSLCYPQDSIAAIEAAVTGGVDVINFSIGGSSTTYLDAVDLALRNASTSGVFVATTAGNGGARNGSVEHPVPWLTTVAAASHRSDAGPVPAVAAFSSRGPVKVLASKQTILKPDLGAPGVSVLSAVAPAGDGTSRWSCKTGTSMASPHVAGLAALIGQGNPTWSPMAIKSALMTSSARYASSAGDHPFTGGAGFTDARSMLNPGLVFDSGEDDWAAFLLDPAAGSALNAPSVQLPTLTAQGPTVVPRTVTNVGDSPVTYTAAYTGPAGLSVSVSPQTFTLAPGVSRSVEIAVANTGAPPQDWQHGAVLWTAAGAADVRIPVIARGSQLGQAPVVDRWAGRDRFGTAAEIASRFPDPVDTVYLSSGTGYADALAASPTAAAGLVPKGLSTNGNAAPILLAGATGLPGATLQMLDDLDPTNIVLLGGTGAISGSVEDSLIQQGYRVKRVGGGNRFDTAANLAAIHQPGAPVVYVANGQDGFFADALAGSALAAKDGGPVLLTRAGSAPQVVTEAIADLNPDRVVVLGGPTVVSNEVFEQVGASERIYGDDRYKTAAEISRRYDDAPRVFIASGVNWPDALAGSVIAGSQGAPVLITRPDRVPGVISERLAEVQPGQMVVLGGTGAVFLQVEQALIALAATWN
ncbi:MAG: cell wall-binding repeat-containing protein [Ornithinimicrobium sp.]